MAEEAHIAFEKLRYMPWVAQIVASVVTLQVAHGPGSGRRIAVARDPEAPGTAAGDGIAGHADPWAGGDLLPR